MGKRLLPNPPELDRLWGETINPDLIKTGVVHYSEHNKMTKEQLEQLKKECVEHGTEQARHYKSTHPITGQGFDKATSFIKNSAGLIAHTLESMTNYVNEYVKTNELEFTEAEAIEVQRFIAAEYDQIVSRFKYR